MPGLIAARSGQLKIPVEHEFSVSEETVAFNPENGWHIQRTIVDEDSKLVPEEVSDAESISVSVADLAAGESESVQFLCQSDSAPEADNVELTYTISRNNDDGFTVRVYPENFELLNVNYMYTYNPESV